MNYIVWVTPTVTRLFATYVEAWRFAEEHFARTGHAAFVEAVQ